MFVLQLTFSTSNQEQYLLFVIFETHFVKNAYLLSRLSNKQFLFIVLVIIRNFYFTVKINVCTPISLCDFKPRTAFDFCEF